MPPKFCLSALKTGVCSTDGCQRRHDVLHCQPCAIFLQPALWNTHVVGRKHLRRVGASTPHPTVATPDPGHGVGSGPVNPDVATSKDDQSHSNPNLIVSNEDGIDFGVVERHGTPPVFPRQTAALIIETTEFHPEAKLVDLGFVSTREQSGRTTRFAASLHGESQWIEQGHPRTVTVIFIPLHEGSFAETLELTFRILDGPDIVISRSVTGIALPSAAAPAGSASGAALPSLPQIVPSNGPHVASNPHMPRASTRSQSLPRPQMWSRPSHLPGFPLPPDLKQTVKIPDGKHWQERLQVEGTALQPDMVLRDVRIEPAHLRLYNVYFTEDEDDDFGILDIKIGDYAILVDVLLGTESVGRIHTYKTHNRTIRLQGGSSWAVMDVKLSLSMQDAFTLDRHANYDLRFKLNRMPLPCMRMRQAMTMAIPKALRRLLFPTPTHITARKISRDEHDIREMFLYNANIRNDRKQMQCVLSIIRQPAGSVPFIIYGPPGTGKTVTTVESILQLLLKDAKAHILACTQTNAAADLLTARLYEHLSKEKLFRLVENSRNPDDIGTEHMDAVLDEGGAFDVPPASTLVRFRAVVCTCSTAGTLQAAGLSRGHFSHIFIDDAAQATEPETMIPIRIMAGKRTNIVLAGDKEQLRPVVKGLDSQLLVSYIERLMRMRDVYGLDSEIGRSGQTIVQLQTNRRSHPAIIAFSNSYIYEDSLEARADPAITTSLLHSPVLEHANPSFPIVFEGVYGKVVKAKHSKFLYNEQEANIVRFYCQKLLGDNERPLRPEEIGVITPDRAQVKQIRKSLGEALDEVSVGSVEQFQGQERRVIIVSTVRSMRGNKTADFIRDRNSLNVALTRAKALVIIIGDPNMLGKAGLWRHFLNYVHSHGGCLGEQFNWNPDNETDIVPAGYDRALREQPATRTGPEFVERVDFESTVLRYIADPMLGRRRS